VLGPNGREVPTPAKWRRFIRSELRSLRHGKADSIADWRGSDQGLAAVQDFDPAFVRSEH